MTEDQQVYVRLERALRQGDIGAARALFPEAAAFPNVRDPLTWTHLLALAISWSPIDAVRELLVLGADPRFEALDGFPAVYGALSSQRDDRLALVELLLDHGADPNARGVNDYTPLHLAVSVCDEAAARLLLARGGDPTLATRIDDCATPLDEAIARGNHAGARMLRRLLDERQAPRSQ